ncbi:hypothetical protein [Caballeronia sp. LZ001]|uniref:hypothetical protein n=1 Tax=Caballeronia sp. LZ001 TaxID=3038553 RepID=UPI0028644C60|nr:hypothetical protein [Caballeronia sp. LZ001]MDR5801599.1 hypothetical protein [Caballeronia sp. LZ001]
MDDLKKSVATLNKLLAQRDEIQRKQAEVSAALDSIAGEQQALSALRQERKKALGKAVIEGKKPDTADLDKQIAAAEKRIAAAGDNKTANEAAAAQLEETLEAVDAGIEQARDMAREAAGDIVATRLDEDIKRFENAKAELRNLAVRVAASDAVARRFRRNRREETMDIINSAAMTDRDSSSFWAERMDASTAPLIAEINQSLADAGWQL